jgi:hypothetical protein
MDIRDWLRTLGLEQYEAAIPRERDYRQGCTESDGGGLEGPRGRYRWLLPRAARCRRLTMRRREREAEIVGKAIQTARCSRYTNGR